MKTNSMIISAVMEKLGVVIRELQQVSLAAGSARGVWGYKSEIYKHNAAVAAVVSYNKETADEIIKGYEKKIEAAEQKVHNWAKALMEATGNDLPELP